MGDLIISLEVWLNDATGFGMSIHGYLAIVITGIGVFGLYGFLLWLMRKSRDSQIDEGVYHYTDPRQ